MHYIFLGSTRMTGCISGPCQGNRRTRRDSRGDNGRARKARPWIWLRKYANVKCTISRPTRMAGLNTPETQVDEHARRDDCSGSGCKDHLPGCSLRPKATMFCGDGCPQRLPKRTPRKDSPQGPPSKEGVGHAQRDDCSGACCKDHWPVCSSRTKATKEEQKNYNILVQV